MCGVSGIVVCKEAPGDCQLVTAVQAMTNTLKHRGPDDGGIWIDQEEGIAFGHRRLAIIDLSDRGRQPMRSQCGRYILSYNGELYNYKEIRNELQAENVSVDTNSDTAVLLTAFSTWGLRPTLERCHGMFAFALWDAREKKVFLARDRLGEKPMYYGYSGSNFLFGSELKALVDHPAWDGELDRNAIALQLRHGFIPAPHTIYKGIYKLVPGTVLELPLHELKRRKPLNPNPLSKPDSAMSPTRYWSVHRVARGTMNSMANVTEDEAVCGLERVLERSIERQMVADVPLGAFLSGGVDSSVVVALMQRLSHKPIQTFTIGFEDERYNEAEHAKAVADYLGTDHNELYVASADAMEVVPCLPVIYDEPFSDPSQIPTYILSKLAKSKVTVSLSGDGGDELFAGYDRYLWALRIWDNLSRIPKSARKNLAVLLAESRVASWEGAINAAQRIFPKDMSVRHPGQKINKLGELMLQNRFEDMYHRLTSYFGRPAEYVLGSDNPEPHAYECIESLGSDPLYLMQYIDSVTYLPDDILVKLDRASMAVSLESRVPFLDQDVVEYAWSLPKEMKLRQKTGKHVLRELLYRHVPRELVERPKKGFGIPLGEWLRGGLRSWTEDLLSESSLRQEGIFDCEKVRKMWKEHASGSRNWEYELWNILSFQSWYHYQNNNGKQRKEAS